MLDIGNSGSGDFTPWVKYNAKAGRWYIKGDNGDVEVQNPVFVADFANIKTGWFYFASGQAPEKVLDPSLTQRAEKPARTYTDSKTGAVKDAFKRGFLVNLYSKQNFGGVVELSSTAEAICTPIGELYKLYSESAESKTGQLPVVSVKGANPVTGKHGTNYVPVFQIEKWVARPAELEGSESTAPVASAAQAQQAAPTQSSVSEF